MWSFGVFLCLTLVYGVFGAAVESQATVPVEEARLLVSRFMLSNYAVEGKDFIINYHIYNIGDRPAIRVSLADNAFPENQMEVVRGLLQAKWERIAPGANVSHSVVLRPKTYGYFNYTWAEVKYWPSEEATAVRTVITNPLPEGYIYRQKDFERRFSPHIVDWGLFTLMTLPSLAMPSLLWYRTKSKYDAISASGSKKAQ